MSKRVTQLGALCAFLLFASASYAQAIFPDPPDGTYEFVAVKSGPWHDSNTWNQASIPGPGDDVRIPSTCNGSACLVTVQRQEPNAIRFLHVEGEFRLWIHSSSRLRVETIYVASGGTFAIGAAGGNYVKSGFTAEVVFTGSGGLNTTWDPTQISRGLVSDGTIRFYGEPKTHMVTKSSDAFAGDTVLALDTVPSDWDVGDEVVLPGTHFDRYTTPTSSQDEVRTITSINAGSVTLSSPLVHDHQRASAAMDLHVAHLTRNLIFRSETTAPAIRRGHVIFRNGDVVIENAAFLSTGRTDKTIPLNDLIVTLEPNATSPTSYSVAEPTLPPSNPRGRYSVHFHRNNFTTTPNPAGPPPSKVYGSVVRDAIGWGFVNHSSHVDFQRNVVHDFNGAGFVTESGDELGNFYDNIAIRGKGDGDFDPIHRFVFNNTQRPQPLSDFGFRGDGFWFQGPAIRVRNNVASGCDSAGMVWFTPGAPLHNAFFTDPADGYQKNKYSHFERSWVDLVYGAGTLASIGPRHWLRPGETGNQRVIISDLPVLEMDGFEAYGNYVGFRARFNNTDSNAWFNDTTFDYTDFIPFQGANRDFQDFRNLTLWNNQQAFRMRYVDRTRWSNVTAINRLDYDSPAFPYAGHDGAEFYFALRDQEFITPLVIAGYPVAGRIQNGSQDERTEVSFNGQNYSGYANFDSWRFGSGCNKPSGLAAAPNSFNPSQVTLSWASSNNQRYSVRHRPVGDQLWTILGPITSTSTTISGLSAGQHEFQVVGGCPVTVGSGAVYDSLSVWSDLKPFTVTSSATTVGQVGQVTNLTHAPQTIAFGRSYSNPVVIAQPPTYNGSHTSVVRITNVSSTGFTMFIDEAPNMDGAHTTETVNWIVLEAGNWQLADGTRLKVGKLNTSATVGTSVANQWSQVNFSGAFPTSPVVMSQTQTNFDSYWVKTRQVNVGTTGFQVALEEDEAKTTSHGVETIGWVAIEAGSGTWNGRTYRADSTANAVTHNWYVETFGSVGTPRLFGGMSTYSGGNNAYIRYRNLTSTTVEFKVEEDTVLDTEVNHIGEVASYLLVSGNGTLTASPN